MRDISELLAILAHEMRTPIAAILGYQELLAEGIYGSVDEKGKEPLDRIAYSAKQLLHLIDGIQEIGTPPEKRLSVNVEPFEPAAVLRICLDNAQADALGRNVKLESQVPAELPEIEGDPDRFCRAIDLALAAAIKTSHNRTLTLIAQPEQHTLCVRIENTGLSAERDNPAFVKANGHTLTGAGLRLAIVREIAHQMHGEITITPTDDENSRLSIIFGPVLRFLPGDLKH
jgi:signal transduction histidine kinase